MVYDTDNNLLKLSLIYPSPPPTPPNLPSKLTIPPLRNWPWQWKRCQGCISQHPHTHQKAPDWRWVLGSCWQPQGCEGRRHQGLAWGWGEGGTWPEGWAYCEGWAPWVGWGRWWNWGVLECCRKSTNDNSFMPTLFLRYKQIVQFITVFFSALLTAGHIRVKCTQVSEDIGLPGTAK